MKSLELRIPPALVVALLGGLMWLVAWATPSLRIDFPARRAVALGLVVLAGAIVAAGAVAFHRAATTVHPMRPEEASSLVTSAIYRFTRNPMYLGLLLALLGWGVALGSPLALLIALLFVPYMSRFQIRPEERALRAAFGDSFDAYARRTRRWL